MASHIMRTQVTVTDEDLRKAWRQSRIVNMTYDAAMAVPALSIALRRIAECDLRKQKHLSEVRDIKRAQANDLD